MNEYNTKITYYTNNELNIKKTLKAYAKFYAKQYAIIIVSTIKRKVYDERVFTPAHQ